MKKRIEAVIKDEKKTCIALVVVAAIYLLFFSPYTTLFNDYFGYDTALWHVIGRGITQGKVPYRDLFEHKGPLLFFLYSFGWLFQHQRIAMYLLQLAFFSVTIIMLYKIARLYLRDWKALGAVFIFLFMFCGTIGEGAMSEEWSLPFILVVMYFALKYVRESEAEHSPVLGGIYGFCFGMVAMIRLNNAAPIAGIILGFVIVMIRRRDYKTIWKNALAFLLGTMIPIIPIAIWYWSKNALDYLWWGAFLFNFKYAVDAWTIRTVWEKIRPWLAVLPITILWIQIGIKWKREKDDVRKQEEKILLLTESVVTATILMLGYSYMHYFTILLPCLFISVIFMLQKWESKKSIWLLGVGLLITVAPFTWQAIRNAGKSILFNGFDLYGNLEDEIRDFMAQIPEDERDSVWGNGTAFSRVYCVSGITPCFPYMDNGPVHYKMEPAMQTQTDRMLAENPPKWIVVATVGEPQIEGLEEAIDEKYQLFDTLDGEKHLELYRLQQ